MAKGGKFSDGTIVIGTTVDTAGINSGLMRIRNSFKKLSLTLAGFLGIQSLIQLGKAAIDAASELQEVQNIVDVTFGDLEWKMEAFASTAIESYGISEFMAKSVAGQFMAMGTAAGIASEDAANMALQLTALAGDMASFYNISVDYARVALSAVYTGETETLKRYGIILTEANLQEYAHSRGIETSVKKMDARTKAMLRYQYILEQTQHIQGDFIRTEENWANQVRVLQERWRQFLITLGSGLITVFNPVVKMLNMILQYVTAWANAVGKVLAKLLGLKWQDFEEEAAQLSDATADLAENEEDLASGIDKATKKAKKSLLPFDELNVLTANSASNASGLADSLGLAISDFETAFDVENGGFEFELPDIDSWYEFGKFLSDTFSNLLNKIDWAKLQDDARTLATNFADFLNGIFQPETFETIGHTIAQALNTAFAFVLTASTTIDWDNIGKSFAAGVNRFLTEFDFTQAAEGINAFVQGLWTAIKTFLQGDENGEGGIDWPLLRNKLAEFFSTLDVETVELVIGYLIIRKILKANIIGQAAGALASALGKVIGAALLNRLKFFLGAEGLSRTILTPAWMSRLMFRIKNLFGSHALVTMEEAGASAGSSFISGFTAILAGIEAVIGGIMTGTGAGYSLSYLFGGDTGAYEPYLGLKGVLPLIQDLGSAIKDYATDPEIREFMAPSFWTGMGGSIDIVIDVVKDKFEDFKTWLGDIGYAISHVFTDEVETVKAVWGVIVDWFNTTIIQPLAEKFNAFAQWWNNLFNWIGGIFQTVWVIIKAAWIVAADWFNNTVITPIKDFFIGAYALIKSIWTRLWDDIKSIWSSVSNWFYTTVITPVVEDFKTVISFITTGITTLWNTFVSIYSKAFSWINENIIQPIINGYKNLTAEIQAGINAFIIIIKDVWTSLITWFNDNVVTKILALCQNIWDGIVSGAKEAINTGIFIIESFINYIIDAINRFTSGISDIGEVAAFITGDSYNRIAQINHVSLPRLANGAVIPPNNEFAAILGDQKHGTNIEAPLDTIVQAFKTALNENDSNTVMMLMQQQVELLGIIADKEFGITDRQIFNSVKKSAAQYTTMTGENAF